MDSNQEQINKGFSLIYDEYDELNTFNNKALWQRKRIYSHVNKFLLPKHSMLEINAGSGIDAVYFAQRGNKVVATDLSDGFELQFQKKIDEFKLGDKLSFVKLPYSELERLLPQKFDYIFSNFGGLNCIEDPMEVINKFKEILNPGGKVSLVIMPKHYPGEWMLLLKDRKTALRRYSKETIKANVEGFKIDVWYHSLKTIKKGIVKDYELLKSENLGTIFTQNKFLGKENPRIFKFILKINMLLRWITPSGVGDYYIVTFQKKEK